MKINRIDDVLIYCTCRRTLRTYFWRKVGGILDYDFRRTCPRITEYWTQTGCTISGGLIASSRTRRRSPSTRCRYRIIIFGCITTKPCFTCRSKLDLRHFHFFAINLLIRLISTYVLVSLQIDARPLLRDEVRVLSPRYSNLLNDDRKLYVLLLFVSILQRNFRFN